MSFSGKVILVKCAKYNYFQRLTRSRSAAGRETKIYYIISIIIIITF